MTSSLVSVVIITHNRVNELVRCIQTVLKQQDPLFEILVVDNASEDGTCETIAALFPQVRIHRSETNLGVPGGRNIGFQIASGDICITIDDDAEFMQPDSISRCRQYFAEHRMLACLSFRIMDGSGVKVARKFIPRRDRKIFASDSEGALFSGTGFAFRRDVFIALGGFWERLAPYFGEEPDISYRILEQGYSILHTVHIPVLHYETPVMRPNSRRTYCGIRNTPWIAIRSLPWFAVITLTVFGWGYFFIIALRQKHLRFFFIGIGDSLRGLPHAYSLRKPISRQTRAKLRQYSGLYWY